MALTRDFKVTVKNRITSDSEFTKALLREAIELIVGGDADTAKLILRDLVNSTVGFEGLAEKLKKPSKSVHRMLSLTGNPTMENLSAILAVIKTAIRAPEHVCLNEAPTFTVDNEYNTSKRESQIAPLISKLKIHVYNLNAARQMPKWGYAL